MREERGEDYFAIHISHDIFPGVRAVSWAMRGGGFASPHVIVNHSTDGLWIDDIEDYVNGFVRAHRLPQDAVVMVTTVPQGFRGTAERSAGGIAVRVHATVGLGNALAAGDPVTPPRVGTINTIVLIDAALGDAACLESVAIATEAKAGFLASRGVRSVVSGRIATGTGTDCTAVVALGNPVDGRAGGEGEFLSYAGKHTLLGMLVADAVAGAVDGAMADSLARRAAVRGKDIMRTHSF